jgi:hypothetical protein
VSQPSQQPAFSYPNQRAIRPPLSRAHRNRVFVAGAVSNVLLTAGLTIVSLAGILLLIGAIMSFVQGIIRRSDGYQARPVDSVLEAAGLSPDQAWIAWTALIVTMLLGAAVAAAGIWIGKAMIGSVGVARPWAVAWSASGILIGVGLIMSTVVSPIAGPLVSIVFGAVVASGAAADESADMVSAVTISIVATLLSLVVYAAAGSLVWWWMAHALRRAA